MVILRQWQKNTYDMCACVMIVNALAQVCIMWVEMFYCGSLGIWRIAEKQQRGPPFATSYLAF